MFACAKLRISIGNQQPVDDICNASAAVQGLPLGSGMGSSAASAAAAAWAVNGLFGSPLSKQQLLPAGLASEATVSGYHADNIAPALLGGFILIRCVYESLLFRCRGSRCQMWTKTAMAWLDALAPGALLVQPAVHTDVQIARGCSSFMQLQLVSCVLC